MGSLQMPKIVTQSLASAVMHNRTILGFATKMRKVVFDAPWQSRAFGMAVSLSRAGYFSWDKFRAELPAQSHRMARVAPMNTISGGSMRWRRR
jgi:hypothetical protein